MTNYDRLTDSLRAWAKNRYKGKELMKVLSYIRAFVDDLRVVEFKKEKEEHGIDEG